VYGMVLVAMVVAMCKGSGVKNRRHWNYVWQMVRMGKWYSVCVACGGQCVPNPVVLQTAWEGARWGGRVVRQCSAGEMSGRR